MTVVEAFVLHDNVGGQRGQVGRDGPGVQVVHVDDMRRFEHVGADLVEVDVVGGGFEEHAAGGAEQPPGGAQHQHDDDQGRDGVGAREAGGEDDDAGDDGGDEAVEVGEDVLERAFHVEAGAVGLGQHPGGDDVHGDADQRDDEYGAADDVGRVDEALD